MTMSKDDSMLGINKSDWVATITKGSFGAIPIAGSFLAEVAGTLIPDQRLDRIAKYVVELNNRLEKISEELLRQLRNNEQFIDLIEESFIKASRAGSEERRHYIVNIVQNGISDNEADINNAKYLLGLLSEISDNEVIWLRYFYGRTLGDRQRFRELHKNLLTLTQVVIGSSKEEMRLAAIQESYKEHLERLGLIQHHIRMNKESTAPEYDRFTNKPKVVHTDTTNLGNLLLENIGLITIG